MLNILCYTKTTLVHDNTFDVMICKELDLIGNEKLENLAIF